MSIHEILTASSGHQRETTEAANNDPLALFPKRWGTLPVKSLLCTVPELLTLAPRFQRKTPDDLLGQNQHFDVIVRCGESGQKPIPVGMVSPRYRLFQHQEVIQRVHQSLSELGIHDVPVRAMVTTEWERVFLCFDLGGLLTTSPDGYPVSLQLWVRNSMDGSAAMRMDLGWLRLVCSNGMVVGRSLGRSRVTHAANSSIDEAFHPIEQGMVTAKSEAQTMGKWAGTKVHEIDLIEWADGHLSKMWGPITAARVLHIWKTGLEARPNPPFVKCPASRRTLEATTPVPGAPAKSKSLYDLLQILSWIASRRSDFSETQAAQLEIGRLLTPLLKICR